MILGDNIFYGNRFRSNLCEAVKDAEAGCATIFGYLSRTPSASGVVEFDQNQACAVRRGKAQKPTLELLRHGAVFLRQPCRGKGAAGASVGARRAGDHRPQPALSRGRPAEGAAARPGLCVARHRHGRESPWTRRSLSRRCRTGRTSSSAPEEVAYHMGWLTKAQLLAAAAQYHNAPYGAHLRAVAEDKLVFERELHD